MKNADVRKINSASKLAIDTFSKLVSALIKPGLCIRIIKRRTNVFNFCKNSIELRPSFCI